MQDVAWVNGHRGALLATGQQPLMELWIYVAAAWIPIHNLADPATGVLKNYLKDISFSTGGARMAPDPIAGQFSAVISNEGNIFHRYHTTSPYTAYFRANREVRIRLGGTYTPGGLRRWQRIIGYMDEPQFSSDKQELIIKGLDYMRVLSDMKFNKEFRTPPPPTPIDNYWGIKHSIVAVGSEGALGAEQYCPSNGACGDAMTTVASGNEKNDVGGWVMNDLAFASVPDAAPLSGTPWIGRTTLDDPCPDCFPWISHPDVTNGVALIPGNTYKFVFKYRREGGIGGATFDVKQTAGLCDTKTVVPADALWHTDFFYFVALDGGNTEVFIGLDELSDNWRFDEFSIKEVTLPRWEHYTMPVGCTGIYYVELDGVEQWPGKQGDPGEGWYYDSAPVNQFYFDKEKNVPNGVSLDIWYFEAQNAENVVADILVKASLYGNRALAIAAMGAPATGVSIDRVWFKAGSAYINAIKIICERCNYRFYFNWGGSPCFILAPTHGAVVFPPGLLAQHITGPLIYQDRSQIWNRIIIEGEKRAELTGYEDNMPSELKDEASDPASIAQYGERIKNIKNHLFQLQIDITNMCGTLLAAYKDPKWYFNFTTPYNAVPLEIADTIDVQELLDINLPLAQRFVIHSCLIRNAEVSNYDVTYKCELPVEDEYD